LSENLESAPSRVPVRGGKDRDYEMMQALDS